MQLSNCELLPGVIVDTNDDQQLGRIKCVIPGYVDASFSNENMPWVRPLTMSNHQSFSKMMKGYKVWILVNKSNYNEYWYFPFFELNDVAKDFLGAVYDNDQPEVLMAHNCGGNHATLTYDENNGFSQKIGQHHIDMHPDGNIEIIGQEAVVDLDGKVKIGVGDKTTFTEQAVLGNKLFKVLDDLAQALDQCLSDCEKDTHTAVLKPGLEQAVTAVKQGLGGEGNILSDNIEIN